MFKTILIPLDGSDYSQTALEYGIRIGERYDAQLQLLHVIDVRALEGPLLHDISASLGAAPMVNYQSQVRSILEERAEIIIEAAEKRIEESGLKYFSKKTVGIVSKEIIDAAIDVDLVAMGRHGEHANWASVLLGSTLEAVIRKSHRPILVTSVELRRISNLLVAYNGDDYATQALHVAANMACELDLNLIILSAGEKKWTEKILTKAEKYLIPYELDIDFVASTQSSETEIIKTAEIKNCDMIVMGAYGENRIHELLLGSTTESVMRNTSIPLLLVR